MTSIQGNGRDKQKLAKQAVAQWVWQNVIQDDPNPRLIIDAGSSAQTVAEVIAERVTALGDKALAGDNGFTWLTVLTHNLGAWQALRSLRGGLDLFLVDGRYDRRLHANIDPATIERTLDDYNPSVVVIAASGLDEDGLYCSAVQDERPIKDAISRRKTGTRVVVIDHSKIGRTDVRRFATLEELAADAHRVLIVTDDVNAKDLSEDQAPAYQKALNAIREKLGKAALVRVPMTTAGIKPAGGRAKKTTSSPPVMSTDAAAIPQREAV